MPSQAAARAALPCCKCARITEICSFITDTSPLMSATSACNVASSGWRIPFEADNLPFVTPFCVPGGGGVVQAPPGREEGVLVSSSFLELSSTSSFSPFSPSSSSSFPGSLTTRSSTNSFSSSSAVGEPSSTIFSSNTATTTLMSTTAHRSTKEVKKKPEQTFSNQLGPWRSGRAMASDQDSPVSTWNMVYNALRKFPKYSSP
mmetsp:Transcript_37321/g.81467  ORF Transcript_37321/g.81467 Transcript_37321/m.81467 type:complete len:203 (+) Transcript_37321:1-609(+)